VRHLALIPISESQLLILRQAQVNSSFTEERFMRNEHNPSEITRADLVKLLNEDLSREYQAIIAYVVYSQVLKGAEYMAIAAELEQHASEELAHALTISKQIDYFGEMPTATPKPVKLSENAREMLQFDLDNEGETIRNYRERVRQAESLGEYALAEDLRHIIAQEQEHQIDLANSSGSVTPVKK